MRFELTFASGHHPDLLAEICAPLFDASPFATSVPTPAGVGLWRLELAPARDGGHLGFASVAEFQLRLCRHVEIESVTRVDSAAYAAAS